MNKLKIITSFLKSCFPCLLAAVTLSCRPLPEDSFTVLKGEFVQSVTEPGELEAIRSTSIIMPQISHRYGYSFKLVGLLDHGTIVQVGDSVAALDPSGIYKYIIQQEEALENLRAKAEKLKVEADISRRDLEVQLKNEDAAYSLKKLEQERMQFESPLKKTIKDLEVKKALLKLEKVERKLSAAPLLEESDGRINELQILQRMSDILNAQEALGNLVLYSPGNGYFQVSYNMRSGQNYRLGDEIYMGSMMAGIPDVSHMKVLSNIHEADFSKLREGMRVVIRLDALPKLSFEGIIRNIGGVCLEKDGQKVFFTEISILEDDPRLKPGMSVSCEYICYESDDQLFVPSECLMSEGGKTYVFVKKGKKFTKTEVSTGISNSRYTIIHTRLKPGRELLSPDRETDS